MSVYNYYGQELTTVYNFDGESLLEAYNYSGEIIFNSVSDYNTYSTAYQKAVLDARDEWTAQYRADPTVIPIILHTDQHGKFVLKKADVVNLFAYLGLAIKSNEISAMVGLGDVDLSKANYPQMNQILDTAVPRSKQINIWGNHDLWQNYELIDGEYVIDFDTVYPCFNNETYGDESYAYNHKGIEYHIDQTHNVKYVCLAGWEIDTALGGHSHYVVGYESMEGIIDMLEEPDNYDIILLAHCNPWGGNMSSCYRLTDGGTKSSISDIFYETPVEISTSGGSIGVNIGQMLSDRNSGGSGTVNDSYGNSHAYDFSNCGGKIICGFNGHNHSDAYGWSIADVLQINCDAYSYQTHPFYFINIDRTQETVTLWKITDDALIQTYTVPFHEVVE